ncbi:diguanylate cyclase [Algiphilus sp.]|uniref:diguanylate cyclase domain-containing protein n=1 Tax=Algiphilus sp. TaxID=1872431 RepID=UPI0032EDFD48
MRRLPFKQWFQSPRPDLPGRGALLLWMAVASVLMVFGVIALLQANRLEASVSIDESERQLRAAIETRLAAEGSEDLQGFVRTLVNRGTIGLRYLSISVPGGTTVAEASAYEGFSVPMISPLYVERLRDFMLNQSGERRRFDIRRDGRSVASVEYVSAPEAVAAARTDAIQQLLWQGWILMLGGMLLLGVGVTFYLRPARPPAMQWAERARGGSVATETQDAGRTPAEHSFGGRAAQALNRLQRGVIIVDADIRIREINKVAERLTGWSREDAVGRLVYSVFHPLAEDDQPLTTPAETAVRERCETFAEECRLRARDGAMHAIEMQAAALEGAGGKSDGAVLFFHDISDRRDNVDRLRADARRTQDIVDHLDEGVLTTDAAGVINFANARAARMFGYKRGALIGATVTKLMPVPFLNMPEVRVRDYSDSQAGARLPRVVGWRQDATTFPVELLAQPLGDEADGDLVLVLRDLTQQLRKDNLSLRMGRLFDYAAEEIYVFDAQSLYFTEVNRSAQRNLGLEDEQLARMTPVMITEGVDADVLQDYYLHLRSGQTEHVRYRARHRRGDGTSYPVEVRLSYSRSEEPPVFMAMATDCSEQEAAESRLARQAMQDELTGLANRAAVMHALRDALREAVQAGGHLAVLFLDIDHFKRVNDRYGHEVGDALLRAIGQRLEGMRGDGLTVARLSGDEFVVLRPQAGDRAQVEAFVERVRETMSEPFAVGDRSIRVTASFGVAVFRGDAEDPVEAGALLSQADRAMYLAKKAGRDRVHVYFGAEGGAKPAQRETRQAN